MTSDNNFELSESNQALYSGDLGTLPLEARRLLIHLLQGPCVDAKRHKNLWHSLLKYSESIRVRLSELFLELIIDEDEGVAFTRQANVEELDAPILLRRTNLTFIDSVLMLFLRQLLTESDTQGARAVISEQDIIEQMMLYERSTNTDSAGFLKRIKAAIENAKKRNVIVRIVNSPDRYEISPILKLLFSADDVMQLHRQYQSILQTAIQGEMPDDAAN